MNEHMNNGGGGAVSQDTLNIEVRVYPVNSQEEQSNLRAFADVTLGGCFAVKGIRVMDSAKGLFMSMPSKKDRDGEYHEICFPTTARMRSDLKKAVMGEYQRVMEQYQMEAGQPPVQQKAAGKGGNSTKKRQGTAR